MTSELFKEYTEYRLKNQMPPLAPSRKPKRPHTIVMSDEGYNGLKDLAEALGYRSYQGGNVTALMEALGFNLWTLGPKITEEN